MKVGYQLYSPAFLPLGEGKGPVRTVGSFLGTHCRSGDGGEKTVGNGLHVVKPAASHFTLWTLPVLIINFLFLLITHTHVECKLV